MFLGDNKQTLKSFDDPMLFRGIGLTAKIHPECPEGCARTQGHCKRGSGGQRN